jgi:hypothetical protein
MPSANDAIDSAISEIDHLRRLLKRGRSPQVRSIDERDVIRATCLTWFNNHRSGLQQVVGDDLLQGADASYKGILGAADRATARSTYDESLKGLRTLISDLRSVVVAPPPPTKPTTDSPPSFDSLVPDPAMRKVLTRRWEECTKCVSARAPLAAAVSKLSARSLVLDGEVAIYDQQLRSRFDWLREPDPDAVATPPMFMAIW